MTSSNNYPIVILISGNGSNLQAIIDAKLPIEIKTVISNNPNAYGLIRAKNAGIKTQIIDHKTFKDRESFDNALSKTIDSYHPKLIVLAGFMRILGNAFVKKYHGKMINLHPSLLPKYPGLDTHEQAIANHDKEHGSSIHFVTEQLDGGPLITQGKISVLKNDTPETLKSKVQALEHQMLPEVIYWFAQGRILLNHKDKVVLNGQVLPDAGFQFAC